MIIDVDLIPMKKKDIPMVLEWMEQEDILRFFGDPLEWLEEMNANVESSDWIWYYIAHTNEPIGFCQFYDTSKAPQGIWSHEEEATAGIDFFIAYPSMRGIGKGKDLIVELLDQVRKTSKFKYVIADIEDNNSASQVFLESLGFQKHKPGLWRIAL